MNYKAILLVEGNSDQDASMLRFVKQNSFFNEVIVVAHNGAEAVDYLQGDSYVPLALVLLGEKLPKVDGLRVLRSVRAASRTRRLPVAILSTSKRTLNLTDSDPLGENRSLRKTAGFVRFTRAARQLGLHLQVVHEVAPASRERT